MSDIRISSSLISAPNIPCQWGPITNICNNIHITHLNGHVFEKEKT